MDERTIILLEWLNFKRVERDLITQVMWRINWQMHGCGEPYKKCPCGNLMRACGTCDSEMINGRPLSQYIQTIKNRMQERVYCRYCHYHYCRDCFDDVYNNTPDDQRYNWIFACENCRHAKLNICSQCHNEAGLYAFKHKCGAQLCKKCYKLCKIEYHPDANHVIEICNKCRKRVNKQTPKSSLRYV